MADHIPEIPEQGGYHERPCPTPISRICVRHGTLIYEGDHDDHDDCDDEWQLELLGALLVLLYVLLLLYVIGIAVFGMEPPRG